MELTKVDYENLLKLLAVVDIKGSQSARAVVDLENKLNYAINKDSRAAPIELLPETAQIALPF